MQLRSQSVWRRWNVLMVAISLGLSIPFAINSTRGEEDTASAKKSPPKNVAGKPAADVEVTAEEAAIEEQPVIRKPAPAKTVVRRFLGLPIAVSNTTEEAGAEATEKTSKTKLTTETPTHEQIATISINQGDSPRCSLQTFCLTPDGKILAAVTTLQQRAKPIDSATSETKSAVAKPLGELRLFDAEGKPLETWPLTISPSAVNVGADGSIFVAGSGKVLKVDAKGNVLLTVDSPNSKDLVENRDAIVKELSSQMSGMGRSKEVYIRNIELSKKRIADLEEKEAEAKKEEKELTRSDKIRLTSARKSLESLEATLASLKEPSAEEKEAQINAILNSKKRISAVAVTDQDVFVACSSPIGWGYDVWVMDHNLANGKKIVEKLRGCCGQMDIQARGENLVVAENSMHRVCCYDRTGKLVKTFGDRESVSKLGFEGCCNPMNCRIGTGGEIYTSESSIGRIRKFSESGEYLGLVGQAKLISGCKHVAVGVSSDEKKVYLLDVTNGVILVMAKKANLKTASK
ncbi:MAG: hypothetical protein JWM11_6752 [Planctomycetaceae bacterium]|nr:hypothetical protein [Planctomycetaceae bacterium]